jgi:acetate kinase
MAHAATNERVKVLCLDGGSSSLKFAVYDVDEQTERAMLRGAIEGIGQPLSVFWIEPAGRDRLVSDAAPSLDPAAGLAQVFAALAAAGLEEIGAIGHRIVFGGPDHASPVIADAKALADLERYVALDPLHLKSQLDLVRMAGSHAPSATQVLCFDSAFHRRMPAVAQRYPLPASVGPLIRRYGYHGLSFEYIMSVLGPQSGRVLIAHLGSGASLAAVADGSPVDTTMGFSPLGGLMMGTRPGDLDPGVVVHLAAGGASAAELAKLFNEESGLLGVSERSANMEEILHWAAEDRRCADAIELFVYQLCKHAGALITVLGGLDTLVFTGGIGERSPHVRALVAAKLAIFGVRLDAPANAAGTTIISHRDSGVNVRVIATDETLTIVRHVRTVLRR